MRFVVVTGMSGGGKRTALKLLEDAGFYCVDNLPVSLVEKFVELIAMPGSEISKVALGLDVRADQNFTDATRILEQLKEKGYKFEILFMDSDDSALIKRYKETRRVHPLAADGRVEDGIHKERKILETIRKNSDYVIDTSNLLVRELKEELDGIFLDKLTDMIQFLIPNYIKEGKYRLVIAIGCTGGKHRSVTLANKLYERLKAEGHYGIKLYHRDVPREGI